MPSYQNLQCRVLTFGDKQKSTRQAANSHLTLLRIPMAPCFRMPICTAVLSQAAPLMGRQRRPWRATRGQGGSGITSTGEILSPTPPLGHPNWSCGTASFPRLIMASWNVLIPLGPRSDLFKLPDPTGQNPINFAAGGVIRRARAWHPPTARHSPFPSPTSPFPAPGSLPST